MITNMNLLKLLQNTRCNSCNLNILNKNAQIRVKYSTVAESDEVIIPKRIPRGPTDILKALANVTKTDPTAAHYKYHDDPYLIPLSNNNKRIYSLAQESGRKAAKWIRDEHPELFQHREAEPPIEAFFPKAQYDETDYLDNEILNKVTRSPSVNDAITIYNIMKKRGEEISDENKQAFLELICFFNETEDLDPEFIEEKWFAQSSNTEQHKNFKKTWKDNGLAEKLFEELPESSKTYSAIIQGMIKYFQVEKAFQYYALAEEKKIVLAPDAYNSLLGVASYRADGDEQRWEIIENILRTMNDYGIKPTVLTLNSVLNSLTRMKYFKDVRKFALKMIAEVKQFDVQPSLASYAYLLRICFNNKGSSHTNIIESILDDLETRKITIQDPSDTNFFYTAMEKCRYNIRDKEVAHRINRLLWKDDNYNFIGNSFKEAMYYRNYFHVLFQTENMEDIMRIYDYLVPHIYTPELNVIEELVKTITMNGATELYQRAWTDIVQFEVYDRPPLLAALFEGMSMNRVPRTDPPSKTAVTLSDIAWSIYQKAELKSQQRQLPVEWTGKMLGEAIILLLHANEFDKATEILKKLVKDEGHIVGVPDPEVLTLFMDFCIENNNQKQAMECITYSANNGYGETNSLAKKMVKNMSLSSAVQSHLAAMVGTNIFQEDEEDRSTEQRSI